MKMSPRNACKIGWPRFAESLSNQPDPRPDAMQTEEQNMSEMDIQIERLKGDKEELTQVLKAMHDEYIEYGVINFLGGHNNHNVRWARTVLGMQEHWTPKEAEDYVRSLGVNLPSQKAG